MSSSTEAEPAGARSGAAEGNQLLPWRADDLKDDRLRGELAQRGVVQPLRAAAQRERLLPLEATADPA